MHPLYRQLHCARAAAAVTASQALADMQHAALKGQLREILVQDFLNPLLPPQLGIASGVIVSADGATSTQQDLVVYDRSLAPPALVVGPQGVIPVDSVLFTIEVKSQLTAHTLRQAHDAAMGLRQMNYVPPPLGGQIFGLMSCLFAFNTDLATGSSEVGRYQAMEDQAPPALMAICVVGRGYWFWGNGQTWEEGSISALKFPYAEMVDLVSSILQSYDRVSRTRSNNINPYFRPA